VPASLFSAPTLIWMVDNEGPAKQRVETSYLASKLAWTADYVLTVRKDDRAGDLDGWVTLTNHSGTSFPNASLQLVAGNINRVRDAMKNVMAEQVAMRAAAAPAPMMREESFSEYHLYTLGRKTTINHQQTKQVSMLEGDGVPVQKRYVVDGNAYYYRNAAHPGSPLKDDVRGLLPVQDEAKGGLGMPMPAGTVRVYQEDANGGVQFVGEDRIDHTPKTRRST